MLDTEPLPSSLEHDEAGLPTDHGPQRSGVSRQWRLAGSSLSDLLIVSFTFAELDRSGALTHVRGRLLSGPAGVPLCRNRDPQECWYTSPIDWGRYDTRYWRERDMCCICGGG
eukprot:UN2404